VGYASVPPGEAERRIRSRWKPASLLYVELDGSNGGVVLNINESGLAMHAAQTVVQDSVSRLRFKLPSSKQEIVASGRIAWKGGTRKELGLHFLNLPEVSRLEIRKWIQADGAPRRPQEKVRPFPVERLRAPAPIAAVDVARQDGAVHASADAGRARYPISSTIADALRKAKEVERPAATPEGCPAEGSAAASPSLRAIRARSATAGIVGPPATPVPPAATSNAVTKNDRAPGGTAPVTTGSSLIPSILSLKAENPEARRRAAAASVALEDSRAGRGWRWVLGLAMSLAAFLLGLAVGGRDLVTATGAASSTFARAWKSLVAGKAAAPREVSTIQPEPIAIAPATVPLPAGSKERVAPAPRSGEQKVKPAASRPSVTPAANLRAAAGVKDAGIQAGAIPRGTLDAAQGAAGTAPLLSTPLAGAGSSAINGKSQASSEAGKRQGNPEPIVAPVPPAAAESGTVAVHSRMRSIRIPSDLRFLSAPQDQGLHMGELLSGEPPVYPRQALRERVEGTVRLRAVIANDGAVASVEVISGPAQLTAASLEAVRGWHYEPTQLGGQAVEWEEDITVVFRLQALSADGK